MDPIEEKLGQMGLTLPVAAVPLSSYVPFKINGCTLILSGVISIRDGVMTHMGQVGSAQTVESGHEAARVCALNSLASIKLALGQLDRVQEFLFVSGYVNAVSGFEKSPQGDRRGQRPLRRTLWGTGAPRPGGGRRGRFARGIQPSRYRYRCYSSERAPGGSAMNRGGWPGIR